MTFPPKRPVTSLSHHGPEPVHRRGLGPHRRGTISIMIALLMTVFMLFMGLIVDEGFWTIASTRLQVATDSAAMGASLTLGSSVFQAQSPATQQTNLNTVAQFEASAAASKLAGTMQSPTVTYDTSKYTWVKVVLKSQAPSYFASAVNISAPLLTASATVSVPPLSTCALMLGSTGMGVEVDNTSTLTATNCNIMSDSASNPSIYLNSGTIAATGNGTISAVGSITKSNSGTNTLTPAGTSGAASVPDPIVAANKTAPSSYTCASYPGAGAAPPATLSAGTYCGGLTITGTSNGQGVTFNPGTYYIVNGDLNFDQALITSAVGVTFVITGTSPGSFYWTNNSGNSTITATSSGVAIWMVCNTSTQQYIGVKGGSTLNVGGLIYAPCAQTTVDNNAQLLAATGASFALYSSSLYVTGKATLTLSGGAAAASTKMMLSQ